MMMVQILLKYILPRMTKVKNKIFIYLSMSLVFFFAGIKANAEIISQEMIVEYKEPEKLQFSPNKDGIIELNQGSSKKYNLIEEIDVYALSPHAKLLLMPHMVDIRTLQSYSLSNKPIHWQNIAREASKKHGIDYNLILAVIQTESNFIADAISHVGAQGAMQIMPETAKDLGLEDPFDPEQNVDAGTRYLKEQILRFNNLELALAAYNAGPGNVIKYNGIPPFKETQDFVKKVISRM